MRAEPGKVYAVLNRGRAQQFVDADTLPEWNENDITVVEVPSNVAVAIGDAWDGEQFAPFDPLPGAKAARIVALRDACQSAIYAGFESNALGTAHLYPALDKDQANLSASVLASLLPNLPAEWTTPFWCAVDGVWSFWPHTAAQIQQVGTDAKAAILAHMAKNAQLAAQVEAATTIAQVNEVQW